ncbi:hypothetical protein ACX3YG_21620 [Pseudomonas wadenswilerensis]
MLIIPPSKAQSYKYFFDKKYIKNLLLCPPGGLIAHIHNIYQNFPELADRFWPAYLLTNCPIPADVEKHNISSNKGKADLELIAVHAIRYLEEKNLENLTLLPIILDSLKSADTASKKRIALTRLLKASQGSLEIGKNEIALFPQWINEFSETFSYPHLSKKFGNKIVNEWKIDTCLYCNDEGIQSRGKKKYRTDLDHFYPKAKFPFLAISLFNLVPAGGFCNQRFKQEFDMLDSAHPFADGATQQPLFHIDYPPGSKLTEENYSVRLWPQSNKLDRSLEIFEIAHYYTNNREVKNLVARTFSTIDFIIGLGQKNLPEELIEEITNTQLNQIIDISLPAHSSRKKKFIVDAVNQFSAKQTFSYP